MSRVFCAQLERELRGLWLTPLAWVLLPLFLALQGAVFSTILLSSLAADTELGEGGPLAAFYGQNSLLLSMTLLLLCPALTMRSFAEERRTGTLELLLAAPISSLELSLAKYFGALLTYVGFWLPTLLYPLLLAPYGELEGKVLLTSYLGIFLLGASALALGVLASALSKNQLTALMLAMFCQFGFFLLGLGEYVFESGWAKQVSEYFSSTALLTETSRGILDSRRLCLHLSLSAFALLLTTFVVDSWRTE